MYSADPNGEATVKVLLLTNFTPHYRVPFFERLAEAVDVEYISFSSGTEPYWRQHLGTASADMQWRTQRAYDQRDINHHLYTRSPLLMRETRCQQELGNRQERSYGCT